MRKLLVIIVSFLILFCVAGLAQAREHVVKKGECLSQIALQYGLKWPAVYQANKDKIKDPNLIYPGQVLQISEKGQATDSSVAKAFIWKKGGTKPFGQRDPAKAVKLFNLPEEVKAAFITAVKSGQTEDYRLKVGQRLEQQIFGHYRMVNNVVVQLPPNQLEAKIYCKFSFNGRVYFLIRPLVCGNWAWWAEKEVEQEIKPPAETPPEIKTTEPKKMMMLLIPTEQVPEVPAKPKISPPIEGDKCSVSYESYGWAGHYWALQGGGQSNYYGGKGNFFFCPHETSLGKMREGVGATVNAWEGDNSGYNFRGSRWTVGPVVDLITKQGNRFTTTIQVGQQEDRGHDGAGYEASQRTRILYLGQTADLYHINKYIFKSENWLDVNIDIGHDKDSSWQGSTIPQISDPAENKTNISVGSRAYFWQTESFHGGLVGKGTYAFGDHGIGLETGPFISDKEDIIKVGAGFRHQFNSSSETNNGNLIGIGADLDIVKTIDRIVRYLKTKETKDENKEKEVVK